MPFELLICLRYLKPKRTFVSVITLISLAGVMLGVAVLIVVIAVMSGFDRDFRGKILEMNAHITVSNNGVIEHPEKVIKQVLAVPGVKAASPFVWGPVLIEFNKRFFTPYVKGIDPATEKQVTALDRYIRQGKCDLEDRNVIVGNELAQQFSMFPGDKVTIFSPQMIEQMLKQKKERDLPGELQVSGIFSSGLYEFDQAILFTSLATAQEMYQLGRGIHGISVMVEDGSDPVQCQRVANLLNGLLERPLHAETWMYQNRRVLQAVEVEKCAMFIIIFFIIIVAAFNICSTLITVTVQKTREIGILKAVGAYPFSIMSIFVLQGFVVGVLGSVMGLILGKVLLYYRNPFKHWMSDTLGFDLFPREVYNFSDLPAYISNYEVGVICLLAILLCTAAGIIPALRASRLDPVEALRNE